MGTFSIVSLMSGAVLDKHFPDENVAIPTSANLSLPTQNTTDNVEDIYLPEKVSLSIALTFVVGKYEGNGSVQYVSKC